MTFVDANEQVSRIGALSDEEIEPKIIEQEKVDGQWSICDSFVNDGSEDWLDYVPLADGKITHKLCIE